MNKSFANLGIFSKRRDREGYEVETKQSRPKRFFVVFLLMIALIGIGTSVFFYIQYTKVKSQLNNPTEAGRIETEALVKKVARLMVLPEGETPTVASVSDDTKLKDQAFFNNTTNGDRLLIYTEAKIAVLYRPSSDKIINVGPLTLDNQPGATPSTSSPTTSPTATPKK